MLSYWSLFFSHWACLNTDPFSTPPWCPIHQYWCISPQNGTNHFHILADSTGRRASGPHPGSVQEILRNLPNIPRQQSPLMSALSARRRNVIENKFRMSGLALKRQAFTPTKCCLPRGILHFCGKLGISLLHLRHRKYTQFECLSIMDSLRILCCVCKCLHVFHP